MATRGKCDFICVIVLSQLWYAVGALLEGVEGFSLRNITELLNVDHNSIFVFGDSVLRVELSEFRVC